MRSRMTRKKTQLFVGLILGNLWIFDMNAGKDFKEWLGEKYFSICIDYSQQ